MSAVKVFDDAIGESVAFVPGIHFYAGGGHENTLRLNFSMCDIPTIEAGMVWLGKVINGMK